MDRIRIQGLRIRAVVGVHDWERKSPRELLLDLSLRTDLRRAAASDDLSDTVDYDALAAAVKVRVAGLRARLIERVAEEAAAVCLSDRRVRSVRVTVRKPGAVDAARMVSVTIVRRRPAQIGQKRPPPP
jgi:7,8-dihydroneopterin aldolase/epimerase/oxygenase